MYAAKKGLVKNQTIIIVAIIVITVVAGIIVYLYFVPKPSTTSSTETSTTTTTSTIEPVSIDIIGKYINQKRVTRYFPEGAYFELKQDGVLLIEYYEDQVLHVGQWSVDGDEIMLSFRTQGTDLAFKGKIEQEMIVLENESEWLLNAEQIITTTTTKKDITTTTSSNSTTTTIISSTSTIQGNVTTTVTITRRNGEERSFIEIIDSLPPEIEGKLEVKVHIQDDGHMQLKIKNIGNEPFEPNPNLVIGIHLYNKHGTEKELIGYGIDKTIMPGETDTMNAMSLTATDENIISYRIKIHILD